MYGLVGGSVGGWVEGDDQEERVRVGKGPVDANGIRLVPCPAADPEPKARAMHGGLWAQLLSGAVAEASRARGFQGVSVRVWW